MGKKDLVLKLRVKQLKNVVKFACCDVAIMIFIDIRDGGHDLMKLKVFVDCLNKVLGGNRLFFNLRSVELGQTEISVDVHWFIQSLHISNVDLIVHFVKNYAVLLIVYSSNIYAD